MDHLLYAEEWKRQNSLKKKKKKEEKKVKTLSIQVSIE